MFLLHLFQFDIKLYKISILQGQKYKIYLIQAKLKIKKKQLKSLCKNRDTVQYTVLTQYKKLSEDGS